MKIKLRFSCFFTVGLFFFILYLGLIMALLFDLVMPFLGIKSSDNEEFTAFLPVFIISFISGGFLFGLYFVKPLLFILSSIKHLSDGNYDLSGTQKELYTKSGKLKKRYFLYKEAIFDFYTLANNLDAAKTTRIKLEEAKKNWISGVSHDLKTPLSYIMGYSALLLNSEYTWGEDEKHNFLSEIYTKGQYIEELLGDLNLSFKLDDLEAPIPISPTSFNLIEFMQRLIADVANDPKSATYDLCFQSQEKELTILADEKLLYRAFQNLLMNAVYHNPEGTHIEVQVSRINNNLVSFEISDNGIGLEQEALENLFTKYYQNATKGNSSHTGGLGLVIVKSIIEAHGGCLTVKSEPMNGTVFQLTLPLQYL